MRGKRASFPGQIARRTSRFQEPVAARALASSCRHARRLLCFGGLNAKPRPISACPQSGQGRLSGVTRGQCLGSRTAAGAHALRQRKQT